MPDPAYLITAVAVAATVTYGLRALPFAVLAPLRSSAVVRYLSERMPAGIMVILLVYTLRGLSPAAPAAALGVAAALAVTVGLHLWRRNAVLSILGGTAVHVLLASFLLAR
jgi:branched-subunit amino acid transport protein AzlD